MTILISGACGFMGREVAAQAKSSGIDVVCGVDIAAGVAPYQPDFPLCELCRRPQGGCGD